MPRLIPIAYFSGTFNKMQQLWNITQKECYAVYKSVQKFSFYLKGTDYIILQSQTTNPFFTTGMSSHVLDHWVLELQHIHIKFEHIQGKKNVVADVISSLRMYGLYQDKLSLEDAVKNVIEEIHHINSTPTTKYKS